MAKLLFIENRTVTFLWRLIARKLKAEGHEVHVLVVNPLYAEPGWEDFKVPFPNGNDLGRSVPPHLVGTFSRIARTDRNVRYYGGDSSHYPFYYSHMRNVIEKYGPQLVFGEATTFYELMCADICRELGILYLNPGTSRYPPGRFSFFLYDTLEMFDSGISHRPSREECLELIDAVSNRTVVPDYVRKVELSSRLKSLPRKVKDRFTVLRAYLEGERFCTPSPIRKAILSSGVATEKIAWDIVAAAKRAPKFHRSKHPACLYAMQLQPEAALDVYGTEWNDQALLLDKLARICAQQGFTLLVKANPKFKLEVTLDLIRLPIKHPNVYLLPRNASMEVALSKSSVVISVTGTVLLECILSGKPAIALKGLPFSRQRGCTIASGDTEISAALEEVKRNQFVASTEEEKIEYLTRIARSTFRGLISEPLSAPECMLAENILDVAEAFKSVVNAQAP